METPTSTRELVGDEPRDEERHSEREGSEASSARPGDATDTREESRARTDEPRDGERTGTASFARGGTSTDDSPELLPREQNAEFQTRWEKIQTGFVDEPRQTVEQADELVAEVMKRLAEGFATERERLEGQWGRGEDVSTEDLRIALQRYRGFFQRLLSA